MQPFVKSPASRGSGLGLAIAAEVAAMHDGELLWRVKTARPELGSFSRAGPSLQHHSDA